MTRKKRKKKATALDSARASLASILLSNHSHNGHTRPPLSSFQSLFSFFFLPLCPFSLSLSLFSWAVTTLSLSFCRLICFCESLHLLIQHVPLSRNIRPAGALSLFLSLSLSLSLSF